MLTKRLHSLLNKKICRYSSTGLKYKSETENIIKSLTDDLTPKEKLMLQDPDYFKVHNLFTVEDLFNAKVHYGHKMSSVDKRMKPFLFGHRLGHTIFDLDKTAYFLKKALNFVAHIAYRNGIILFVSQNPRVTLLVENTAKQCKEYAVAREWREGIINDSLQTFKRYVRLPDVCIILNVKLENNVTHSAVLEAAKMCIPTVGIVDSNADPSLITYPVPGNDDSFSAISLYCNLFEKAILRGKKEREEDMLKAGKTKTDEKINEENMKSAASIKIDESLKTEESVKIDESLKTEESIKSDENLKIEESVKSDENLKNEKKVKSNENLKIDKSKKSENYDKKRAKKSDKSNTNNEVKVDENDTNKVQ